MQQSLPLGGEGEGLEIEMIMNEKELDKLLRAALERRAANVPPLPSDFAERVLERHRASAVRSARLHLLQHLFGEVRRELRHAGCPALKCCL